MLATSNGSEFPGLAKLRQMGQRMAMMRRTGLQSQSPAVAPQFIAPQVPGLEHSVKGVPEMVAGLGDDLAGTEQQSGQTDWTRDIPEPQAPPPPAVSSLRDVNPPRQRGLSSFRPATRQQSRVGL